MAIRGRYGYALGDGRYKFIQIDHDADMFGERRLYGIKHAEAKAEIDSIVKDKGFGEYYYPSDEPGVDEGTPLETASDNWYIEYVYTVDEDDTLTRYMVKQTFKNHEVDTTELTNPTVIKGEPRESWERTW